MLVRRGRPAMATMFEAWLGGDDEEHLAAVAEAALDEIARVERLLSRFDPAAEVARVNREAFAKPVRVDRELLAILLDCGSWFDRTDGYFDVRVAGVSAKPTPDSSPIPGSASPKPRPPDEEISDTRLGKPFRFAETVVIDEEAGTVRLLDPSTRIDLGGYGKGYALNAALRIIDDFGVASAFLHGGTSSAFARGRDDQGRPWRVGIRDPFADDSDREITRVELVDCGFSSSATFRPGLEVSDVIDPTLGVPIMEPAGVSVVAATALEAEVWSTAFLAMGRDRASRLVGQGRADGVRVAWIDRGGIEWLGGPGGEACHEAGASGTA